MWLCVPFAQPLQDGKRRLHVLPRVLPWAGIGKRLWRYCWSKSEVMRKRLTTAVVIASLLTGSAMGQKKYERPSVKTPDSFRGAAGTGPTDQTSIGDLKWFEVFQDQELQKLVKTAIAQNYDLRA